MRLKHKDILLEKFHIQSVCYRMKFSARNNPAIIIKIVYYNAIQKNLIRVSHIVNYKEEIKKGKM